MVSPPHRWPPVVWPCVLAPMSWFHSWGHKIKSSPADFLCLLRYPCHAGNGQSLHGNSVCWLEWEHPHRPPKDYSVTYDPKPLHCFNVIALVTFPFKNDVPRDSGHRGCKLILLHQGQANFPWFPWCHKHPVWFTHGILISQSDVLLPQLDCSFIVWR